MEFFPCITNDRVDRELRLRYAHGPPYRSLLSYAPTPLKGSAHAPPINGVGADCDSQPEKEIKRHFLLRSASLAAQQRPLCVKNSKEETGRENNELQPTRRCM